MPETQSPAPPPTPEARLARALHSLLTHAGSQRPPAANLAEQLAYLERDVQEVRTRVNALFFTVLTAVLGQLVARVFG